MHENFLRVAAACRVEAPTFDELGWATAIAGSRAYRVRGSRGETGDTARLLPIVDLANYAPAAQANCDIRNAPTEGGPEASTDAYAVSLYALKPIAAGTEVLIDYGSGAAISNERLLLEYGFVLPVDELPRDTLPYLDRCPPLLPTPFA